MRTRSAFDLINDVRVRCDQVATAGQVPYIDDATILEWLNQAWADLYDHLVKSGEHYYLKRDVYVTGPAVDSYPLPTDHYKTVGVSVQVNGAWEPAHRFQFERRDDMTQFGGGAIWVWPFNLHYDLWGQNMQWREMPNGGYSVRHFYYPTAARMTLSDGANPPGSGSFIDGVNGWELYVIDWAAKKCAERDENADLAAMFGGDIAQSLARIVSMSSTRNPGEAPRTRIVRGRGGGRGPIARGGGGFSGGPF